METTTARRRPTAEAEVRRGLGFAAGLYGASILLSRVIGLLREAAIGRTLGNSGQADVYFTAFVIPDFLNYLLAGGALSLVFIPLFHAHLSRGDEAAGWRAFSHIANFLAVLLIAATVVLAVFAPALTPLVAPGLDAEQKALLVRLVRIILPAQIFHVLGGLLSATLQARERHALPALAPLLYTGGIVVAGLALGPTLGAEGFAWGVLAGSFLGPFLLPLIGNLRSGLAWTPALSLRAPDLRTYLWRSLPIMLGFSVVVFDDFLLRHFGSLVSTGTIARLNYAKTLMRVPMGVFGLAAGMATFPVLARLNAEGRTAEASRTLVQAVRMTLVLALAAQAALTVCAPHIALLIWGQRRFTPAELSDIGLLTGIVSLGLWAWSVQGLLARGFYARGDTWTPTVIGSVATLAFYPLYGWLGARYGGLGLGLASSAAISVNAALMAVFVARPRRGVAASEADPGGPGILDAVLRLGLATAVGIGLGTLGAEALTPLVEGWPPVARALFLGGLGAGLAGGLTLALGAALRVPEVAAIVERLAGRVFRRLHRRPAV